MRRALRWLFGLLLILLLLLIAIPLGLIVALNTQAGRDFAVKEINHFSGGKIVISGLGGHFPADIKLASLTMADAKGVWLTGNTLELRWTPNALLDRELDVTALTASSLDIARAPVSARPKKKSSPLNLHHFTVRLDRLAIGELGLGAAVAGQPLTLAVEAKGKLLSLTRASLDLTAIAADGKGRYQLAAAINRQNVDTHLQIAEPPDGLIGHYAGPKVHAPLHVDLHLAGPRDAGALDFSAELGAAKLDGSGTLDLNPDAPAANVVLDVPSLAPYGQLTGRNLGGTTRLHLIIAQQSGAAALRLDGDVALTAAPKPAVKLVGNSGHVSLRMRLKDNVAQIENLAISGAGFDMTASGRLAKSGIDLTTHLVLDQVADVSPSISGNLTDDNVITGTPKDFAVQARLSGTIKQKEIPSGPFQLTLDAQHLPDRPVGTLTASGALENAPLALNAAFARGADGAAALHITRATWRSINLKADLALAAGAKLPTGTATFSIRRLVDLSAFSPVPVSGSISGDFAHRSAQNFQLHLIASNLNVSPALGAINGRIEANGTLRRLAVTVNAEIAKLRGAPLRLATTATVDADTRRADLSRLTAAWKTVNLALLGPASVQARPGIVVQHLALGMNGGTLRLDGRLSPSLDLKLAVNNLPASLAELVSPSLKISGTLGATAHITGSKTAPAGEVTLRASQIKLHSGEGQALPPADFNAQMHLSGSSANLIAKAEAGPDVQLSADGQVPLKETGPIGLRLAGLLDLRILDPVLAAQGTTLRGTLSPDFTLTGTPKAPLANGTLSLAGGSVQNIGSGLDLLDISAQLNAAGRRVTLQNFSAKAGQGSITGHGTVDLGAPNIPIDFAIDANNATPVASDLVTENIDANLTLSGALKAALRLAGSIDIRKANINIPKSLPPSVAKLPIYRVGEKPPPPPAPPPDIALNLLIHARNQIFIRGDGLFAEVGGRVKIGGTSVNPIPSGGFTLIRGNFALGGKTLQFTQGVVSFNGGGFIPTLDLEATTYTTGNDTATLIIGGTAAKPTITLTSSPPLPSDEILSQLLFGQSTETLSPFQAASLAAALASLSGIGGSAVSDPLGGIRNALGLDELSLGGGASGGAPSLQAGRYIAPGVFVGAQQSTSGSGTQATVEVNLYKGLKLQTETGTSTTGTGDASSVGLTYQFNY